MCGSTEHGVLLVAEDTLHHLPGRWTVRRCVRCGHGFTSPRPDRSSIRRYYPDDYQPFSSPVRTDPGRRRFSRTRELASRLLDPREVVLPGVDPGDALEVGCGSGRVLADLARRGWRVRGLEPSAAAAGRATAAAGVPVDHGTVEGAVFPDQSLDLVLTLMVLEHLHDPLTQARRIAGWLRPGGHLSGSVPNAGSWELRAFGPAWFALQVPTHLQHFTPGSLSRLLTSAGFERPRIVHQRNVSNLVVQLGWVLRRRGWPGGKLCLAYPERGSRVMRLALWPLAFSLAALKQAGRISFIARRAADRLS